MIGPYRDLQHLASNDDGIFAGLPLAVQRVILQCSDAASPMTTAPAEPRVSDELVAAISDERVLSFDTDTYRHLAKDLRDARATIASQAAELAAKDMLVNMLKIDVAKLDNAIAERDAAEAALKAALGALANLRERLKHIAADNPRDWQKKILYALDNYEAALTKEPS